MTEKKQNNKEQKRYKFRFIIADNQTFDEKVSFPFSIINVIITLFSLIFIIFVISYFLFAFSPLKTYIPGCNNKTTLAELYKLNRKADSLEQDLRQKNLYLENIKKILNNEDTMETVEDTHIKINKYDTINIRSSKEDSIFRAEFESEQMFNLYFSDNLKNQGLSKTLNKTSITDFNFFVPVHGIITSRFNPSDRHFGVDIVAAKNEIVKATLQGTVIFSNWTLATGYVLIIQHPANIISVYKHCSVLLVKTGDAVEAGDPVAITGQSGEQQTGPHLHFEIWYNGTPTDPTKFMLFDYTR
jgi:murein DD-endopeptidase MepM/ murein hydrolase activator NlpD